MEISRILTENLTSGDEDDHSEPLITQLVVRPSAAPRRRKVPLLERLREQKKALECAAANLQVVLHGPSPRTQSEEDGEASAVAIDTQRMRDFLRRSVLVQQELQQETVRNCELQRQVRHSRQRIMPLVRLVRGVSRSEWECQCDYWDALADEFYVPLSMEFCMRTVQETLQAFEEYKPPKGARVGGGAFFGWRDLLRLDGDQRCVHFVSGKTYDRSDIARVADLSWRLYHDRDEYKELLLGPNVEFFHKVLQRVTPDVSIIETVEKYPGLPGFYTWIWMIVRKETKTGHFLGVRSIAAPQLERVMRGGDGVHLVRTVCWTSWDVSARDAQGVCSQYHLSTSGYLSADVAAYPLRWMSELIVALVRTEGKYLGVQPMALLPAEAADEISSATSTGQT